MTLPSQKKNPAQLRVHNIPKKVHSGLNSFPLYFEWLSKTTHSICLCSCGTEDNVSLTHHTDISKSASHLLLKTTNSLTVAGFAEQPNNTCFPHSNYSNILLPKIQNTHPAHLLQSRSKIQNAHRIPLGVQLLLLELGELSSVVDDHQQLPDEQKG